MLPLSHRNPEVLSKLYYQDHLTLDQMSDTLGVSESVVLKNMVRFGLPRRQKGLIKYTFNMSFFDKWSSKMAWALGVFLTDGCFFSGKKTLSMSSTDLDLAQKITTAFESDRPIQVTKRSGKKDCYIVTVRAREIEQRLAELGLTERKTKTLVFPNVPGEVLSDFVRGLWDGDGHLGRNTHYGTTASFGSASHGFIQDLLVSLSDVIGNGVAIYKFRDKEFWQFSLSTVRCLNLIHWMYDGSSEEIRMDRKFQIAESLMKRI